MMTKMTLGELRKLTKDLPDETPIGPRFQHSEELSDLDPSIAIAGIDVVQEHEDLNDKNSPQQTWLVVNLAILDYEGGETCDECEENIPDVRGAGPTGLTNCFHAESCSLYEKDVL